SDLALDALFVVAPSRAPGEVALARFDPSS
ncbi:MAG: hypothetical protein QG573_1171, partial [Acidobacteriota bacterium]|nr:hypothetical protein [Acidobacteriota bacterium]